MDRFNLQSGIHRRSYSFIRQQYSPAHNGAVIGLHTDATNTTVISAGYDGFIKVRRAEWQNGRMESVIITNWYGPVTRSMNFGCHFTLMSSECGHEWVAGRRVGIACHLAVKTWTDHELVSQLLFLCHEVFGICLFCRVSDERGAHDESK